jgi:hypothetical protein
MSEWKHGLVAAGGLLVGFALLVGSQFVGPVIAGLLQLAAPLTIAAGFGLAMRSDSRAKTAQVAGSPWLAMAMASVVGGVTACGPPAVTGMLALSGLFAHPSVSSWTLVFGSLAMVVMIMTVSGVLSMATAIVAGTEAIAKWARRVDPL